MFKKSKIQFWVASILATFFSNSIIAATISPSDLVLTVSENQTVTIQREVLLDGLGPAASKLDVFFLADNTGSMGGAINNVKNNASTILSAISGEDPRFEGIDVSFGVASYFGDPREYGGTAAQKISRALVLGQPITKSAEDTQSAINRWRASGGGDGPEANFFALHQLATNGGLTDGVGSTDGTIGSGWEFGWREDTVKLIVWFGDIRSHTTTVDINEAIQALTDNNVIVAAINTRRENSGIDTNDEATRIVEATNGYLAHNITSGSGTLDAILSSVNHATVVVDLQMKARNLPSGLTVEYSCASAEGCENVSVGESRIFDMTLSAASIGEYAFETYVPFVTGAESSDLVSVKACLNDLNARGSRSKISVTWTDTGADHYAVYRSLTESGPFEKIATTTSRYSTYGDRDVEAGTTYFYKVAEADATGYEYCESIVAATSTSRRFVPGEINRPPVISSSPGLQTVEGREYQYQVIAKDPEDSELNYALSLSPTGMEISPSSGLIIWTPQNHHVGEHVVVVSVSDEEGLSDNQLFSLTVTNTNEPPVFTSVPLTYVKVGESYSYAVQAIDPDIGDTVSYTLLSSPVSMTLDIASGLITWIPEYGDGPSQEITIRARDSFGAFTDQNFTLVVEEPNRNPEIESIPNENGEANSDYSYQVEFSDPDSGDSHSFSLLSAPEGMTIDANNGLVFWTPERYQVGEHNISIQVEDSGGLTDVQSFVLVIQLDNQAPTITSSPVINAAVGLLYSYAVIADDAESDPLVYTLNSMPTGMIIDPTDGSITWTPTQDQLGSHQVEIEVNDNSGNTSIQSYELNVIDPNQAPVVTSTPELQVLVNDNYSYQVLATDPNADAISFELEEGPDGMQISSVTGELTWTPSSAQLGAHSISIKVLDSHGIGIVQSYVLTVVDEINLPPSISSLPTTSAKVGVDYSYQIIAADPEGQTLIFSLMQAPVGMEINESTGEVSWLPTDSNLGMNEISIRIEDSKGAAVIQSFDLTVYESNAAPSIVSVPIAEIEINTPYRYEVRSEDPELDTLTYGLLSWPSGMTINADSGLIEWLPGLANVGDHQIIVYVQDSNGLFDEQSFTLNVSIGNIAPPQLTNTPKDTATFGEQYRYLVSAQDAFGYSVTVTLVNGPDGMVINNSRGRNELTWTPQEADCTKEVTLKLEDHFGNSSEVSFSITVYAAPKKLNRIQCSVQNNTCGG